MLSPRREALRKELSYRRDVIAEAALRCFIERGVGAVTIGDIIDASGSSKSSVYREFPAGKDDVLRYLHVQTLLIVDGAIARRVESPFVVEYRAALLEGARGLFDGLSWAPWTGQYLVHHPGQAVAYLLNPEPGGLIEAVSERATRCAEELGANDARRPARQLMTSLLTEACDNLTESDIAGWPSEYPEWPTWIETFVGVFLEAVDLNGDAPMPRKSRSSPSSTGSIAGLLAATGAARL